MGLADRKGQVDVGTRMSFTANDELKEHRFPRIARLNEQVGTYSIVAAQEVFSRFALLRSGVTFYEPDGGASLPDPRIRRLVGGCINSVMVSVVAQHGSRMLPAAAHTLYELHQSVVPH